jgi:hypothetical protein
MRLIPFSAGSRSFLFNSLGHIPRDGNAICHQLVAIAIG